MLRKASFWLVLVVVAAAAGGGYWYYDTNTVQAQVTEEATVQTATVRRGSIIISASGSGSVIPVKEIELGFQNSGRLSELNVEVGDEVKEGDVLASRISTESETSLALKVSSAELTLLKAEQNLADLQETSDNSLEIAQKLADLEQARLDLIEARDGIDDAEYVLNSLLNGRGSEQLIAEAKAKLVLAGDKVGRMQEIYNKTKGDADKDAKKAQALADLEGAKREYNLAQASVNWYLGEPTEDEIAAAETGITLAHAEVANLEAKIIDLEEQIEELRYPSPDSDAIAQAEVELKNAQLSLESARETYETEVLTAPSDGIIVAVSATVGDTVSTNSIITLYDLSLPMLEVYVDETDFNQIGIGYEIEVEFDALPDQLFSGKIVRIDPSLQNISNVQVVRATAQLDAESFAKPQTLPVGLNASVEVIGSRAENVLLVPVEAVRELSEGSYGVFVMENGSPKLRVVEVGLMDYTYAEIISGLELGDVVTTGIVETGQ